MDKHYLVFTRKRQILRYSRFRTSHPARAGLLKFKNLRHRSRRRKAMAERGKTLGGTRSKALTYRQAGLSLTSSYQRLKNV